MKKALSAAAILFMTVPVFGQGKEYASKGAWELGGSAGYHSVKMKLDVTPKTEYESQTLSLAPEVGYFVIDKLSLGVLLDFSREKVKVTGLPETTDTSTAIFFAPTYVFKQERISPYVGGLIGILLTKDNSVNPATDKTSTTAYGARGGVKIKLGGNSLLNLGLLYMIGDGKFTSNTPETKFDAAMLEFTAGFTIFL